MARLAPGDLLEVRGGDEHVLERCDRLGYLVTDRGAAGGERRCSIGKPGRRVESPRTPDGRPGVVDTALSPPHTWSVRGSARDERETRLHTGRHSFSIGPAVSFRPDDPHPSAIEHVLAALAADIASSFAGAARDEGVEIDSLECQVSGQLHDPLAGIGVVGAAGSPQLSLVTGTVYVSADAGEAVLRRCWCRAIARSPLFNTLSLCAALLIDLRIEM